MALDRDLGVGGFPVSADGPVTYSQQRQPVL
jgi:hypothetical protein